MTSRGWVQILLYFLVILAVTRPLGRFMFRVLEGEIRPLGRFLGPFERAIYRFCRIDPMKEQRWPEYASSLLTFSAVGLLVTYALQRVQHLLPLNPLNVPPSNRAWLSIPRPVSRRTRTGRRTPARRP